MLDTKAMAVGIAAILLLFIAVVIFIIRSNNKTKTDEEKSWLRTMAFALYRMSRYRFLDRQAIGESVTRNGLGLGASRKVRTLFSRKWPIMEAVGHGDDERERYIEQFLKVIASCKFTSSELKETAIQFWEIGLAGYGLPIAEFVDDERLVVPFLYKMANGDYGGFHANSDMIDKIREISGTYAIYSRRAGSKAVEKSLLIIVPAQTHEKTILNQGHDEIRDGRAIAFEISKDLKTGRHVIRGGTFIPFSTHSVALLSTRTKIIDDFVGWMIKKDAVFLKDRARLNDRYFKQLTIEARDNREIKGTFQIRDSVGWLVGISLRKQISDEEVEKLGRIEASKFDSLGEYERDAIDRLSAISASMSDDAFSIDQHILEET